MSRQRHSLTALVLLSLFAVSPAWGRGQPNHRAKVPSPPAGRLLALFSVWLGSNLPGAWLKGGCYIDPNGQCLPGGASENGCKVDPNGRCGPATFTDNGCLVDPAGRCMPGH